MTEPVSPTAEAAAPFDPSKPIVARAGRYYRNARYIMTVGLVVLGVWFLKDGFKTWPEHNEQVDQVQSALNSMPKDSPGWVKLDEAQRRLGAKHTDLDITVQKVLGFALPVVAVAYLVFFTRKSRGEIRLEQDTLTVPGHPPVPLSAVTKVDDGLWKKKGIATVHYDHAGTKGFITLDDFVYQQTPIDAIYDRVLATRTPVPSPGTPGEG